MMEEFNDENFIVRNIISISSFLLGTLLLIVYLISKSEKLLFIGLMYVFFISIINILHLLATIIFHFIERRKTKDTLIKIGLILTNIPIAYLYTEIVVYFFKH